MIMTKPRTSHKDPLKVELERMKRLTGLGLELDVVWKPSDEKAVLGEVKEKIIYIYEVKKEKVIGVLRHEFIDYCISEAIEPIRTVLNNLIKLINEDLYKRKEKIVEALMRLLFEGRTGDRF